MMPCVVGRAIENEEGRPWFSGVYIRQEPAEAAAAIWRVLQERCGGDADAALTFLTEPDGGWVTVAKQDGSGDGRVSHINRPERFKYLFSFEQGAMTVRQATGDLFEIIVAHDRNEPEPDWAEIFGGES